MERYLDLTLSPEERAEDLLSRMSVEEKMAQTQCVLVPIGREAAVKAFCTNGIGEISTLEVRNIKTLEEGADFIRRLQEMIIEASPHHIPAIFHMEGLTGAMVQDGTSFPTGIGRASGWDPELEEAIGGIIGRQETAVGVTHTLAPVLDISRDARMGRQGETYGEDPTLAAAMGTAYSRGLQSASSDGRHTEAIAKHFMGFHNSDGGIHGAASQTPKRLLLEVYGKPFQAAIKESGLRGVMPCYCTIDGEAASASKWLLTDVLRDEMGLEGVALSDYSAIDNMHNVQQMYETITEAGLYAMSAGMDIETPIRSGFNDELASWFRSGRADIRVLDQAVMRILTAKFRMGLFEHPYPLEGDVLEAAYHVDSDHFASLKSARESMILLKNEDVLPISPQVKKIALIGCHADNARFFFGGYTLLSMVEAVHAAKNSIAGVQEVVREGSSGYSKVPGTDIQSDEAEAFDQILQRLHPGCKSLYAELKDRYPGVQMTYVYGYPIAGSDESGFEEALEAVRQADIAILTLGGKYGSGSIATMGEGVDSADINLPVCQEHFIHMASQTGTPLVGIHFGGRAVSSDMADQRLQALIEAWAPSECGAEAIVDVLSGKVNPSGKLPVSVAYHAGQIPVYYNHPNGSAWHQAPSIGFTNYVDLPHTPRYPFGYGLSYTSFAYENLQISKEAPLPDETFTVSADLTNTGDVAGTEVVQLYLKDVYASMTRPQMELAGFARVELKPGERKRVTFTLKPSLAAFLDVDMKWKIEKGLLKILIGASSEDIRLHGKIMIKEDQWIQGRDRMFYASVKIE